GGLLRDGDRVDAGLLLRQPMALVFVPVLLVEALAPRWIGDGFGGHDARPAHESPERPDDHDTIHAPEIARLSASRISIDAQISRGIRTADDRPAAGAARTVAPRRIAHP